MRMLVVAAALSCLLAGFGNAQRTIDIDPDSYAAVAVSESTGKYGYAYNYRSRRAAEKMALKQCDAPDAKIACWINLGFIALARGDDKSCWGVGWVYGGGVKAKDAAKMALDNVDKFCTNPNGAYVTLVLSSDGKLILEQRDKSTIVDQDGNVHEGRIAERSHNKTVIDKNGNIYDGYGRPIGPNPSPTAPASSLGKASSEAGKEQKNN